MTSRQPLYEVQCRNRRDDSRGAPRARRKVGTVAATRTAVATREVTGLTPGLPRGVLGKTFTQTRCYHVGVYDGGEEIPLNRNFCARPPPASAVYTLPLESAARW